jgi:hypothetical protein
VSVRNISEQGSESGNMLAGGKRVFFAANGSASNTNSEKAPP